MPPAAAVPSAHQQTLEQLDEVPGAQVFAREDEDEENQLDMLVAPSLGNSPRRTTPTTPTAASASTTTTTAAAATSPVEADEASLPRGSTGATAATAGGWAGTPLSVLGRGPRQTASDERSGHLGLVSVVGAADDFGASSQSRQGESGVLTPRDVEEGFVDTY
jgi:hypothetical protein